jgi:glyoxalase-like protein
MPRCHIDHLVITAPNLAVGVELVRSSLGVMPQAGGEHPRMGTHNCLLKLEDCVYLEIISPNPDASKAERARWFELDDLKPDTPPRLATWAVRTTDIRATLAECTEPLGNVESMSRGRLNWLITIPGDGSLPFDGIAPTLIEWKTEAHPASSLQDVGCSLVRLELFHPEAPRISALLRSISVEGEISVAPPPVGKRPYLAAHIQTPSGLKRL